MAERPQHCDDLAQQILDHNPHRMRYNISGQQAFEHHMLPIAIGTNHGEDITFTPNTEYLTTTYAVITDDKPPIIHVEDTTPRLSYLGITDLTKITPNTDPGDQTPAYTKEQLAYHLANKNPEITSAGITYLSVGNHRRLRYGDQQADDLIGISNQALYKATRIRKETTKHLHTPHDLHETPSEYNRGEYNRAPQRPGITSIDATTKKP